ncbi:AAA-ATPase [Microbacterium phage Zayuliv]|nr:AAA-ATPase [Microbacterium phage Zayuliv]
MLIAFEGPDNVGKSHSAAALTSFDGHIYNATKTNHALAVQAIGGDHDLVQTFDRIDWFTHMVYRLAYPERDWNDDRPRTVFAMPDTHFVLKMHHPLMVDRIEDIEDGIEAGKLAAANEMYFYQFDFLTQLNRYKNFALFKTMSIIEVANDPATGSFHQKLVAFSSPYDSWTRDMVLHRLVDDERSLLEFLREEDRKI